MTWGEFKQEAERKGVIDTDEIYCIDVYRPETITVYNSEEDGVSIE